MGRFIYVDESGISANERIAVVAGVIVHTDTQYKPVRDYIKGLVKTYIPDELRRGFSFHATDMYHGASGTIYDRREGNLEYSRDLLKLILSIPRRFGLPIVYGYNEKPKVEAKSAKEQRGVYALHHAATYACCAIAAERCMCEQAGADEIASLVAENNNESRELIKFVHMLLQDEEPPEPLIKMVEWLRNDLSASLPITKIGDCVFFAEKTDSVMLQLADACAFTIRRYLEKKPDMEEFAKALVGADPAILNPHPSGDNYGWQWLA